MKTLDFWFDLPEELIAQTPITPRNHSRMMCMDGSTGALDHKHFYDLTDLLTPGDTLILNDSRVLPARLYGTKENTGAAIEFLLLEQKGQDVWETMVRPGKKAKTGVRFVFGGGLLVGEILQTVEGGNRLVKFTYTENENFYTVLEKVGQMPLPPYITQKLEDKERYQTVYSKELGSVAAPTAGLHFTQEMLQQLRDKGVNIGYVTLHVGLGTFRPVKVNNVNEHHMHSEHYHIPQETVDLIDQTHKNGRRVIGVGTTACRTVESVAVKFGGQLQADDGYTDIFLYPGCRFQVLDGLVTNFHLPESTLIMLVSAFAGYNHIMHAYQEAVKERYRFFSFGDCMFLSRCDGDTKNNLE